MQNYSKSDASPSFSMQMLASKHPLSFYLYMLIADTPLMLLIPTYFILVIYSNLNFFIIVNGALEFMCQVKIIMAVHQWWGKTSNMKMYHGVASFKKTLRPPRLKNHYKDIHFLPISSQKFLILIWSNSEQWKADFTLEPPVGFVMDCQSSN